MKGYGTLTSVAIKRMPGHVATWKCNYEFILFYLFIFYLLLNN